MVTPVLLAFFAGVWFLHDVHDRKGDTLRLARYQAWAATRPGCSGPVRGQEVQTVQVPLRTRPGAERPSNVSVASAVEMACNEEPNPEEDILSVLEWATSNGADALVRPAIDTITGFLPSF